MSDLKHIPVLLNEAMELLSPKAGETAVDCTTGLGGHSEALAVAVGKAGSVVGFDLDETNLRRSAERIVKSSAPFIPVHESFVRVPQKMEELGLKADIVLADLGISSTQMDDPGRGFSFASDAPLDMRFDQSAPITAADLVTVLSERDLADLIHKFGEEPLARKIARKLAQNRKVEPIRSTAQLARLVTEAYGQRARSSRMHPATRTFMALRIAVNDELGALRSLLESISRGAELARNGTGWLNAGARVAVISFHSLEDRLVKHSFADMVKRGLATALTKKPVAASEDEVRHNPRARSAKLRAVRIDQPQKLEME